MFQDRYQNLYATPNEIASLSIDSNYIKRGSFRRIFKNVQYDAYENQQLKEFKTYLDSIPVEYLKEVQNDSVLLRFLYAHKFVKEDTVNYFVEHLNWLNNLETINLEDIVNSICFFLLYKLNDVQDCIIKLQIIKQLLNFIQIIGRDEMLRPVLHISLSLPLDDLFIKAITNKLIIMEDYMFIPGKVESWIVIVDLSQTKQTIKPEKIESTIKHFVTNFPMSLEQIYFLEVNLIMKQIGENVLNLNEIKKLNFVDKITITEKQKYEKEKIQFLSPEYVHLFENDTQLINNLQKPQNCQQQESQSSLLFPLSPNQVIRHQPNQSNQMTQQPVSLILNQPQPTLYGQQPKEGELVGPLYPMIVYASAQPQPYVPEYHNQEFLIQPTTQGISHHIINNNQNYNSHNIPNNQNSLKTQNNPQQQLHEGVYSNPDYLFRTKYDDLIDQYNWNKYGVTQQLPPIEPEKIIHDVTLHISSPLEQYTPTLQGTQQTIKKNDPNFNHNIYSTYNNNHFEDPILTNKDHFPQFSEHPSFTNYDHSSDPLNKYTKINPPIDSVSPFNQYNQGYELDPQPHQSYQKLESYPIHHQIEKQYDFGPIPNRPSEHSFTNSQIIYDKPLIPDRSSIDTPITSMNYIQPKYQSYLPQTLNNNQFNYIPIHPQTIPLSSIPQNSGYSPYYPQQPFSPIPSSTNLYIGSNYPIPTYKPSQSTLEQPKIVEQDGIKFQDETMVIGDNDHRQTKNSNRDPALDQQQCAIY